eukprot:gene24196-biopygen16400
MSRVFFACSYLCAGRFGEIRLQYSRRLLARPPVRKKNGDPCSGEKPRRGLVKGGSRSVKFLVSRAVCSSHSSPPPPRLGEHGRRPRQLPRSWRRRHRRRGRPAFGRGGRGREHVDSRGWSSAP